MKNLCLFYERQMKSIFCIPCKTISTLFLIVIFLLKISDIKAEIPQWTTESNTAVSFDINSGKVILDVNVWNDDGGGANVEPYNKNAGFCGLKANTNPLVDVVDDEGYVKIHFNTTEANFLKLYTNYIGSTYVVHKNNENLKWDIDETRWSNNAYNRYLTIWWYPTQSDFDNNTSQTIHFNGLWWVFGLNSSWPDQTIDNQALAINTDVKPQKIVFDTPAFTTDANGKPVVKIHWSKPNSLKAADHLGKIYLCMESTTGKKMLSTNASGKQAGDFMLSTDSINLNKTNKFVIYQEYIPRQDIRYYQTSDLITVPAFQQVNSFEASLNQGTRQLSINWTVPGLSNTTEVRTDPFLISGSRNISVDYNQSQIQYSYSFVVPEGIDSVFSFNINRLPEWENYYKKSDTTLISTNHYKLVNNPDSTNALYSGDTATIRWSYTGNLWSKGTQFIITRENLTSRVSNDIILTKDEFLLKRFYDEMIKPCNVYQYKLKLIPNENYTKQSDFVTNTISPIQIGTVKQVTASKGYFSNRVELSWVSDGVFDNFSIRRKQYNEPDSLYKQISLVPGSVTQTLYNTEDVNAVPGVVYMYQVVGNVLCAGETRTSLNTPVDIGFRTPTGDIYGRITFSNGQAVEGVEVLLESESDIRGKSYKLNGSGNLTVSNSNLLADAGNSVTLEAWIKPDSETSKSYIFQKSGMYELYLEGNKLKFATGGQTLVSALTLSSQGSPAQYLHASAVASNDSLYLYMNGIPAGKAKRTAVTDGNSSPVVLGNQLSGYLDEIRIWNKAMTPEEIKSNFNRNLSGGEIGLKAYYTFNYAVDSSFYDMSFNDNTYNENHGKSTGASLETNAIPTSAQLSYKGISNADGTYSIRSIPYKGNGTSYSIIPRLGIHTFEPVKDIRFIGPGAQSHTVNFTDKSSFSVSGKITYKGGTIPVEGVMFQIDGKTAVLGNGMLIQTDAQGKFTISVPIGTHEVRAVKNNHTFENDGKITDSNGLDLNYQDNIFGLELIDITTVRYIGRVAGGTVQEAFPIGHSLSKNNLADGIRVVLGNINQSYKISDPGETRTITHFKPSDKTSANVNTVNYGEQTITIFPNEITGEFVADVIPENFSINVIVSGHNADKFSGQISFKNSFITEKSVHAFEYRGASGDESPVYYSDTVYYNKMNKFIIRYTPEIRVVQLENNNPVSYFGKKEIKINTLDSQNSYSLTLFDEFKGYLIGKPVFEQASLCHLEVKVFERYMYKMDDGTEKPGINPDEVPTQDAKVQFGEGLTGKMSGILQVDSIGQVIYQFNVGDPELTSAVKSMTATAVYGESNNPTSIPWRGPDFVIIGARIKGIDFVTNGPDKLLYVLRDPPGTNSYSYLEKGTTFKETSSYNGSVMNTGSETFNFFYGARVMTFTGVGAGVIQQADIKSEVGLGIVHEEQVAGTDGRESITTTLTRFQTSDNPNFVGADGDVYVGYSTNISFGSTDNINIVSKEKFEKYGGELNYSVFNNVTPVGSEWLLVKETGIGLEQNFKTMFAYPQIHIEEVLLPSLTAVRNSILKQQFEVPNSQEVADTSNKPVYISKLNFSDPNFGKSNTDKVFDDKLPVYDGESYKIYFPSTYTELQKNDTILEINQSIDNWKKHLKRNEEEKVNAKLKENYSFHAGAPVSYAESFSGSKENTQSFYVLIGQKVAYATGATINTTGGLFQLEEDIKTQHGGDWSQYSDSTVAKGFVLQDDGYTDYLSVDVCVEDTTSMTSGFIFKTKAGATSCPYEGEYKTKYYTPATVINQATLQIEVPDLSVKKDFIENVPSGQPAYFTLYMRNNSELLETGYFNLLIVDEVNPNGARFVIDGAPVGSGGRTFSIPAGETLVKTLEVSKGTEMNYDNLKLYLQSQCQWNITDTVTFSVHFTPSCSNVNISNPSNNWAYTTNLDTIRLNGNLKHYMDVVLNGFDVNYDNFDRLELQYKTASEGDDKWKMLMSYYTDTVRYNNALQNGFSAEMIKANDAGTTRYKWSIDDMPDQLYDLRAVSVCLVNNQEIINPSEIKSGIKDMYNPRLFGNPLPASGILTINDEIRLNFNEKIAEGYLTDNNFEVTGIKNGAQTDHSASVSLDGVKDELKTETGKNWSGKDITVEMWILAEKAQSATFFSHGNINNSFEFGISADNHLKVRIGGNVITSTSPVDYKQGNWAHVAITFDKEGFVSAYYNFIEYISRASTTIYTGEGNYVFGKSIAADGDYYAGKIHNARIWDKVVSEGTLQTSSLSFLSGRESNLMDYYPMNEAKGTLLEDKASGLNLQMNNAQWSLPEGYAARFNGSDQCIKINTGSLVLEKSMDYTIEFWFKADKNQKPLAVMVSNGAGDGSDVGDSYNLFSVGFENSQLMFKNNGLKQTVDGNYMDDSWHHFALSVNRNNGRAQVYLDGKLKTFFEESGLGSIGSAYMYLGARGWTSKSDLGNIKIDSHFKGIIDEFRVWDLFKNELVVSQNNNKKLGGKEKGLRAYYPFETYIEHQGIQELKFSTADNKVPIDSSRIVPDATKEGADTVTIQSAQNSPVVNKGPVSKIPYNFVVNNDALIITLKEAPDRIEKTIISFTVDEVRDVNGNMLISPIKWSAYIDRNQLKWSEKEFNLEKPVYNPLEFSAEILNKSGSLVHFTLNNMPPWLSVSPTEGVINPASFAKITFSVDEGLNVGSYNEIIYMRNDDNVVEALPVNIRVMGEKPVWVVNPANYKYNMSVFGRIKINGIYSNDNKDILAAFENGKCIGVTNNLQSKENGMYYALLTVYNNALSAQNLEFRIWDASTGTEYQAIPDRTINFVNNAIVGTPTSPVLFTGDDIQIQNIPLKTGWNWLSFNVVNNYLTDYNRILLLNDWTTSDIVKSEQGGFASYNGVNWIGSFTGFNNVNQFLITSPKEQTLSVSGSSVNMGTTKLNIVGNGRWNYISYLPKINLSLKEALAGYTATEGDVIKSHFEGFAMYSGQNMWIGNLTYLKPGYGYMLYCKANSNVTLQYPSVVTSSNLIRRKIPGLGYEENNEVKASYDYPGNMSMIVSVSDIELSGNEYLCAYIGGELRGKSRAIEHPKNNNKLFFLTIAGDTEEEIEFTLERNGEKVASKRSLIKYTNNGLQGSIDLPVLISFENSVLQSAVYPIPFSDVLNIDLKVPLDSKVNIVIYDSSGRIIDKITDCNQQGLVNIRWKKASKYSKGLYLVSITVDDEITYVKAIKK